MGIIHSALPVSVSSHTVLGNVHSMDTYCIRDNGFNGNMGNITLLTYGDTLYRDSSYSDKFRGMVSNSVVKATSDPLEVIDVLLNNDGWPEQFCPVNPAWDEDNSVNAIGITNVVEIDSESGILFFLKNYRPSGVPHYIGAGVATVTMKGNEPSCTRVAEYWWDAAVEPWYGDIGILKFGDYIYAYGHGNHGSDSSDYIYVCRVLASSATTLSAYEYWNGSGWQKDRLYNASAKESVFWEVQSGQIIWSSYYNCLLFVYTDGFLNPQINARTASSPTGPWSSPVTLYKEPDGTPGSIYGALPQPNYDTTGKTLVCTYTKYPNNLQAVKVTFE
ncbi:hypothetical protein V1520DRAFT_117802 [Lipomyces starkeyi]|uniref:DUF4185 domain-containing protein n=1 Tax=Lipomyces starkeyi NRRL Y-11557 TaxID=675824 RepID=A0A1E3Q205_LIPST|nr:hypothetical protein LIPSTDRAFT_97385 [Lipomyces starkeyi NRRL Y-11557]